MCSHKGTHGRPAGRTPAGQLASMPHVRANAFGEKRCWPTPGQYRPRPVRKAPGRGRRQGHPVAQDAESGGLSPPRHGPAKRTGNPTLAGDDSLGRCVQHLPSPPTSSCRVRAHPGRKLPACALCASPEACGRHALTPARLAHQARPCGRACLRPWGSRPVPGTRRERLGTPPAPGRKPPAESRCRAPTALWCGAPCSRHAIPSISHECHPPICRVACPLPQMTTCQSHAACRRATARHTHGHPAT